MLRTSAPLTAVPEDVDALGAGAHDLDRRRLVAAEQIGDRDREELAERDHRLQRRVAAAALDLEQRRFGHADAVGELLQRQAVALAQTADVGRQGDRACLDVGQSQRPPQPRITGSPARTRASRRPPAPRRRPAGSPPR